MGSNGSSIVFYKLANMIWNLNERNKNVSFVTAT